MKTVNHKLKNLEMSESTYKLRRKVIDMIYLLKNHIELPRIEVRITENHEEIMGMGTVDDRTVIWITSESANLPEKNLLHLVAHEIGHAVFKLGHSKCPLMKQGNSMNNPASLETIVKVLSGKK